jgi:ABC-type bacteriocin/lantibiotic exporter with double-glycine peptidase domain
VSELARVNATSVMKQRADGDCGIAALAMYSEQSYEDAYVAISKLGPDELTRVRGKQGLYNSHLIAAAKHLGVQLTAVRKYDLDDDEGVLRVRWNKTPKLGGHFVAVKSGLVFDPTDATATPWRDYLERYDARPCTLLKGNL